MNHSESSSFKDAEERSLNQEIVTSWKPNETLGEHLERRGVSRREFNKWCLKMISLMGVAMASGGSSNAQEIANQIAALKRPVVVWLQLQECTGCLESAIRSYNEEIGDLVLSSISIPYVELLMAPSGDAANKALEDAIKEPHILVVNGSIPKNDDGIYCTIAGETSEDLLRKCAENATHILAVGSCAYYGSVQAARPNPTGAVGVRDILTDRIVVNVPGCPPIGDVITAVLMYILTFNRTPECDREGRPLMAYSTRIHNNCQRRAHFDAGQFVNSFDDDNAKKGYCLYKVGCKGPNCFSPCPILKWNGGVSFPIQAGHPCIGCTELHFFDRMTPFYKTLPNVNGFGIEGVANVIGAVGVAGAGAAIAAHAIGSMIHYKQQHMKEEANVSLPAFGDAPGAPDKEFKE